MCPPWCTTVRAAGHTFAPGIEKFLPKVVMDLKNIVSGETGWDWVQGTANVSCSGRQCLFEFKCNCYSHSMYCMYVCMYVCKYMQCVKMCKLGFGRL